MMENILLAIYQILILSSIFLFIIVKYHKLIDYINKYNSEVINHYLISTRENKEAIEKLRTEIHQKLSVDTESKRTLI